MAQHWETERDRNGYREIVRLKIQELRDTADEQDKSVFSPTSPDYPFVAILVSGAIGCANAAAISEGMGFDPDFVHEVVARLRANVLWNEDEYACIHELGEADGHLAFYLHLNVSKGLLAREGANYRVTDAGVRHVQSMLRK